MHCWLENMNGEENLTARNHGHVFNNMDDGSRFAGKISELQNSSETELGEVKVTTSTSSITTSTPIQVIGTPCKNGACKNFRPRPEPRAESPWHMLKSVFLVSVIVALFIWVIVYTLLAQYKIVWRIHGSISLWNSNGPLRCKDRFPSWPPSFKSFFLYRGREIFKCETAKRVANMWNSYTRH